MLMALVLFTDSMLSETHTWQEQHYLKPRTHTMGTSTTMSDLCNTGHVSVEQDKNVRGHLSCHGRKLTMPSPALSCPCYKHP